MNKTFKGIQISLVIAISLLILTLTAYLSRARLSQTKSASSNLSLENQDQEGLPDSQRELKAYGSNALLIIFHFCTNLFEQSSQLSSQTLPLHQKTLILRC